MYYGYISMKKVTLIIIGLIIIFFTFSYLTGLISFQGLCGFQPGYLAKPGKEWSCTCIGRVDSVSTSYSEEQYCTGLNISYNSLLPLLYKEGQYPIFKPRSL
jgi:hypothetical protein